MKFELVVLVIMAALLVAGCASSGSSSTAVPPASPASAPQAHAQTPPPQQPSTPTVKAEEPKPAVPTDCNPLKDKTCTTLNVGQEAIIGGELKLTLSGITTQACELDYSGGSPESYLVFDVTGENVGNSGTVYLGSTNFYILDANQKQVTASFMAYPAMGSLYKTQACKDAKADALETNNLIAGSKNSGKVWIELKNPLPKGASYLVYKEMMGNMMVFFKFNNA